MEILRGDKLNVDLARPIKLSELQRERLVNFLRDMFYYVELKEVNIFRGSRIGEKAFMKEWEDKEYELLLKIDESNEEVVRKLGRSWMSIEMKRLDFIPEMLEYAAKKGVDIYKVDIKELVKDYLNEHKEEIFKRKKERKREVYELRELKEEKEMLEEEIPNLKHMIGIGGITKEKIEEKERRLKEVNNKLNWIENENGEVVKYWGKDE